MVFLLEWPTIIVTILFGFSVGFYLYLIRNFDVWKRLGVPYVKPLPFVGSLKECVSLRVTVSQNFKNVYDAYSDKPYVGFFSFDKPSLLVRDPELIKDILVKDSKVFLDRTMSVDVNLDPLFGNGLFVMKSPRWRQMRTNLTPVFTSGKMKNMFYLVDLCCKDLTDFLDRETANGK
jgi:cytochrome P450 family 6